MTYSREQFGRELLVEIDKGYDPTRIAEWAFSKLMDPDVRINDQELYGTMTGIMAMEEGPEFEYDEDQIRALAQQLIAGGGG
ncbi:MAG: hypothetical protein K8S55_02890 [Phycisphaerae bacterium]|nr:hypothetical protein [Phycisphaerae bacterium]